MDKTDTSITKPVALVTGASRGIGYAVAKRLAKEGCHVIITARTVGGLEELYDAIKQEGGTATIAAFDLLAYAKIDELGAYIAHSFGRLDMLVGNAAMLGDVTPLHHTDPVVWEKTLALNVTANWRLIRSMHPLLMQSKAGRAVFVTSGVTSSPHPYWSGYAVSKAALETLIETYAAEHAKTSLKVNLVDPGKVRTAMRAAAMPGENPETLPKADSITDIFVKLCSPDLQETGKKFFAQ